MLKRIRSILLIDDDEITNYLHQMLLEELNVTENISTAYNGQEALSMIQKNCHPDSPSSNACPEVIFLDLNMPGMDGFEFLDEFEKKNFLVNNNIHVIVVTSSNNQKDILRAKSYRIDGYVNKPLTEEKLKQVLQDMI